MAGLLLVRDNKFRDHLNPELHPESPQRLAAIDDELKRTGLAAEIPQAKPRPATEDELCAVHNASFVENVKKDGERAQATSRIILLDPDTFMSPDTYETAKLAAGAGLTALESITGQTVDSSFVAVRPPGHHALADRAMGFCLFNNVAVAARFAQKKLGYGRVFIIDWDVHHGNGTQRLFYNDPTVLFASFHQYPLWPADSGWYVEDGAGDGRGFNLNIPLPAGTGDRGYLKAWDKLLQPVCLEYKPDLILVSAGYDAHRLDPLAQQRVSTGGFAALSRRLLELSKSCNAKVVAFLEGGYNAKALSESVIATIRILHSGERHDEQVDTSGVSAGSPDATDDSHPGAVDERIETIKAHFSRYWKALAKGAPDGAGTCKAPLR